MENDIKINAISGAKKEIFFILFLLCSDFVPRGAESIPNVIHGRHFWTNWSQNDALNPPEGDPIAPQRDPWAPFYGPAIVSFHDSAPFFRIWLQKGNPSSKKYQNIFSFLHWFRTKSHDFFGNAFRIISSFIFDGDDITIRT